MSFEVGVHFFETPCIYGKKMFLSGQNLACLVQRLSHYDWHCLWTEINDLLCWDANFVKTKWSPLKSGSKTGIKNRWMKILKILNSQGTGWAIREFEIESALNDLSMSDGNYDLLKNDNLTGYKFFFLNWN